MILVDDALSASVPERDGDGLGAHLQQVGLLVQGEVVLAVPQTDKVLPVAVVRDEGQTVLVKGEHRLGLHRKILTPDGVDVSRWHFS